METQEEPRLGPAEITRRAVLGGMVALAGAAALFPQETKFGANILLTRLNTPDAPIDNEAETDSRLQEHVIPLYNNLTSKFGTHDEGLYMEENRDVSFRYAMAWTQSRVLDAMADARAIPGQIGEDSSRRYEAIRESMKKYWKEEPAGIGSGFLPALRDLSPEGQFKYVDDNAWLGIREALHHIETGDPEALDTAIKTLDMGIREWDYERGGGIRWNQDRESGRVVVSNATVISLSLLLYHITKSPTFIYWGDTGCADTLKWLNDKLRNPENGLYWDNQYIDGGIGKAMWTYNQSSVAKAMAFLNKVDPQRFPIKDALDLAVASFDFFDKEDAKLQKELSEDSMNLHKAKYNDGYRDTALTSIFFADMLDIAGMVPQNVEFRKRVIDSLHVRVGRLSHEYNDTLQQAGALRLAVLAYLNPRE